MRERDTLDSDNVKMEKTIADDLEQLGKKAKYLEKQFNEANSQLRDIVSRVILTQVITELMSSSTVRQEPRRHRIQDRRKRSIIVPYLMHAMTFDTTSGTGTWSLVIRSSLPWLN